MVLEHVVLLTVMEHAKDLIKKMVLDASLIIVKCSRM
jgi:hypothetical protein